MSAPLPEKHCASCGRRFRWRKKWAADWAERRYCSAACRQRKLRPIDRALEAAMLRLLGERSAASSLCPSEVARSVAAAGEDWRALMEDCRAAARRLSAAGRAEITQGGQRVDPSCARGPIRVRRSRSLPT